MLANISPAVDHFAEYDGEKTSKNEKFVHMVAEKNVRVTIDDIRKNSPILQQMEANGEIKIVGGLYEMNTGGVSCLEE
jgi:carbonic anhydrase